MLKELHIRNFALIESIDLNFSNGFTVFTGETGSGKSIILGALNLILGDRADYSVIRDVNKKAIVEATFKMGDLQLDDFFANNDLDFSPETLIRREIGANGKSRAFINDTPVSLNILNQLTSQLIKIHSQYHTQALKSKKFQLDLVDDLSGVNLNSYQVDFKKWKSLKSTIQTLEEQLFQASKDADYNQFQIQELEALKLDDTNYEALEKQLTQLENATDIIQYFSVINTIIEGDQGISSPLNSILSQINKGQQLHPKLAELNTRIHSVVVELKDIADEATDATDSISIDEETQTLIVNQLDFYNRQLKKHGVSSQDELEQILENYLKQNSSTEQLEVELKDTKQQFEAVTKKLRKSADDIHQLRMASKETIEKQVAELLDQLKLVGAKIAIQLNKLDHFTKTGSTEVELLFTSNKGSELKPIDKAASGGELSRLMLVLERLLSAKKKLPTLLLDEIDTGVSGEVALKMGQMLGEMGQNMQLFSITHLPQVAARGQHHFKVYKKEDNNITKTFVQQLGDTERLTEIAGLMSGDKISDAAIENAKILMQ